MKVLPFVIPKPDLSRLIYQVDDVPIFYDKLHQHEEIQISFIVQGSGKLFAGDAIQQYRQGDIIVIGSNLPHVFKTDNNGIKNSHMISLFFTSSSFGADFFQFPEFNTISRFFEEAKQGFKVISDTSGIKNYFNQLKNASKLNRFIILLQILEAISNSELEILSSLTYHKTYSANEGDRMRKIFEFTLDNYKDNITLNDIARIANMTKNAFCKYFKKRTNKTYIEFLNELRIQNASQLIINNNELSMAEAAELSGYNNISNFNRQFKKLKKQSPLEFRKSKQGIS
ncbi:AraC family transcriptional regulator [Winogradskyella haliclonae]|uniref:AraC family transcriptional regulator n=1 Tax=Winogradskyella haliclonae TaxID=2048558 RepID=A0ABQ2BUX5_9FLAO|nr:AraC family transcriptional regulator [Winogradskyella haliclonae]GGI55854.1 AraC family transcriptional regulator [Winogradskyella haliclonae]